MRNLSKIPFLLLTLPLIAWAQPACDPELEAQCYSALCNYQAESKLFPTSDSELQEELSKFDYKYEPELLQKKTNKEKVTEISANELKRLFPNNDYSQVVDALFKKSSEKILSDLADFFPQEISYKEDRDKVELFYSDMGQDFSEEFKSLMKLVLEDYNLNYISHEQDEHSAAGKTLVNNKFSILVTRLNDFRKSKGLKSVDYMEIYRKRSQHEDLSDLIRKEPFKADYSQMLNEKYSPYKKVLNDALAEKLESTLKETILSTDHQEGFTRSCKLASFINSKLNSFSDKDAENMVKSIQEDVKTKILARLSKETARDFGKDLEKNKVTILDQQKAFPDEPSDHDVGNLEITLKNEKSPIEYKLKRIQKNMYAGDFRCDLEVFHLDGRSGPNQIQVNKFTLALGKNTVVAHELGHWFSRTMETPIASSHSKKKFLKQRECIQGFYPNEKSRPGFKGDTHKTEEDFADFFGSQIIEAKSLFCDGDTIMSFFKKSKPIRTFMAEEGAHHSNSLFRDLHHALVKGRTIPQVCTDLMNSSPSRPKRCEF